MRQQFKAVGQELTSPRKSLPVPGENAGTGDYLRFALLKHPAVFSSYSDWRASVEAITPAKALPDPQLTFQADIQGTLMSLMPGVMFDLMLPGKRAAMGREAAIGSEIAYREYVVSAAKVASGVNKALLELAYLEETIQLKHQAVKTAQQAADVAAAEYQTGSGMGTLESQVRLSNEVERMKSDLLSWVDRLIAARVQFKVSLGLQPDEADPVWPHPVLTRTELPSEDLLWKDIVTHNADLGKMRAMVEMAVAQEEIARQTGRPDFTAGLMADVKQAPWMWRPTATMTLPIWRGKVQGLMAAAKARREASEASIEAELLNMSAELARMLFMIKEADRMIGFIDKTAIPSIRRTVASAQAAVQSGMGKASMIPETHGMEIAMNLERIAALRERELAVTELAQMTAQLSSYSGLAQTKQK